MRIQMRLSLEARVILSKLKTESLENSGIVKTSGEVIDDVFLLFKDRLNKVDWNSVYFHPNYVEILADYTSVNPTTLNLKQETIDTMECFREFFNTRLNMKRTVYRSFIIRIALKAFELERNGFDIFL